MFCFCLMCRLYVAQFQCPHLEAGSPVEQLHHMTYAGFRSLGEPGLQFLDDKQNQHLPGQSGAIFQSQQNQLQGILLHG